MKPSIEQHELTSSVSREDISQRARELWEGYGRPAGRDQEIWLEAERQLREIDSIMKATGFISVSSAAYDEAISRKPRTRQQKAKPKLQAPAKKKGYGAGACHARQVRHTR